LHAPVFSPDGARIAVAGLLDPDEAFAPDRLFSIARSGKLRDEQGAWDANLGDSIASDVVRSENTSLIWREDGLYFLGTERGRCNVYRTQHGIVERVTCGPQAVNGFSVARDGSVAYARADATHPAEVFLLRDGETMQLTHENDEFLQSVWVAQPEHLCFTGARDEESEGWLLQPRGEGPFPLVAYIHGGPATAHGEAFFFEYQLLAARGFGVFYPNIHGSSSYGRDYQCSILRDWGTLDYQDVLAGVDAAVARPWVDSKRLGIAGGSYGGYMTNWVMTHTDRFKAAVTERCLSNMVSFFGTTDHGWLWNRAWGFYPEEDVQRLWDMSPIKYIENVSGALMVVHSERDDRCPIEQGEQIFNALRRLGKETRMVMFPEETHELSRTGTPSRRIERLNYILDWFKTHL
jgi:dipeptidyl aminopeptidase/acylaminoacyl peptidase